MILKLVVSLLISGAFGAILLYLIPPEELLRVFSSAGAETFLLSFALYSLSQAGRTLRWKILLGDAPFGKLFLVNSANILFNNLLPARTGELSWFYYTRRLGLGLGISLWSFLAGRLYDLLALCALFLISYLLVSVPLLLLPSIGALLTVSLLIPYLKLILPVRGKLSEFRTFLDRELTPAVSLKLLTASLLSLLLKALSLYVLVNRLLEVDPFLFTFGFAGGELTTVLPVHGFMGFGTYEAGFVLPLRATGLEVKEALKAGFLAHTFLLISSFLWGAPATALLHTHSRKSP